MDLVKHVLPIILLQLTIENVCRLNAVIIRFDNQVNAELVKYILDQIVMVLNAKDLFVID